MLTNKQKRDLKGLANQKEAYFQIGKDGISYQQIQSINDALLAHELIKIKLLKTSPLTVNEAAIEMAASTHSEIVQIIGRVIVLYRRSKKGVISLPK